VQKNLINTLNFLNQIFTNEVWNGQLPLLSLCEDLAARFQLALSNSSQLSSTIFIRGIIRIQQSIDLRDIFFNVAF